VEVNRRREMVGHENVGLTTAVVSVGGRFSGDLWGRRVGETANFLNRPFSPWEFFDSPLLNHPHNRSL
jgi:hypothetical protein